MYVGRIVAVGKTDRPFAAYRVSSRSFPNRVARITDAGAAIEPLDPEDIKKNPYIAYNCLRVSGKGIVVSNGTHTDQIFDKIEAGAPPDVAIQQVLTEMGYERDDLNTPRIAGVVTDAVGYIGTVRADACEVTSFDLIGNSCQIICTYGLDRVDGKSYPFVAAGAEETAEFIFGGGIFGGFDLPVCSAAWMGSIAVHNPHVV